MIKDKKDIKILTCTCSAVCVDLKPRNCADAVEVSDEIHAALLTWALATISRTFINICIKTHNV